VSKFDQRHGKERSSVNSQQHKEDYSSKKKFSKHKEIYFDSNDEMCFESDISESDIHNNKNGQ
jgi:hypothetical protein